MQKRTEGISEMKGSLHKDVDMVNQIIYILFTLPYNLM
jgi:hypothetical protein